MASSRKLRNELTNEVAKLRGMEQSLDPNLDDVSARPLALQIREQAGICLDLLDRYQSSSPGRMWSDAERNCQPLREDLRRTERLFRAASGEWARALAHGERGPESAPARTNRAPTMVEPDRVWFSQRRIIDPSGGTDTMRVPPVPVERQVDGISTRLDPIRQDHFVSDVHPPVGDLSLMSTSQLFALYRSTLSELRSRGIVRTENAPAGDYAEYLVVRALGGELAPNSEKSWDVLVPGDKRVQVKARVVSDPPTRSQRQLSPFRSFDFDSAVIVLLAESDYAVWRAVEIPEAVVGERSTFRSHVNGHVLHATSDVLDHPDARDLTERLREVQAS